MDSWWRIDKHISRAVKSVFKSSNSNDLNTNQIENKLRTGGIRFGDRLRVPNGCRLIVNQGILVCKKNNNIILIFFKTLI